MREIPTTTPGPGAMTVSGMLLRRAEEAPTTPLLRCGSISRNGQQMVQAVARAGDVLLKHGIRAGDHVALMSANRIERQRPQSRHSRG